MPKPKRKRNIWPFDSFKRTTVYHVRQKPAKRVKPSLTSAKIRALGSHRIVKVGDHYEVPSLDRGSWFDTRDDAQRFIREMKKYNPKRALSVPEKHQLAVAKKTLKMPDAMVGVMGGPSKAEAREIIKRLTKRNPRRKRNLQIGLPSNQFVNAKVRVKGGKVQIMADERVLGKAGFSGSAGLKGVSVKGGAKLNPRKRRAKRK